LIAAFVAVVTLTFLLTGTASLAVGLPVAGAAGGFAVIALRRARAAFDRIDEASPAGSRPTAVQAVNWASRYLVY
jgi:hypothetical protein